MYALIKMVYTIAWNRFTCAIYSFIINGGEIIYSGDVLKIIDKKYYLSTELTHVLKKKIYYQWNASSVFYLLHADTLLNNRNVYGYEVA